MFRKNIILFLIGGSSYAVIEWLYKNFFSHGTTHWTMFVVGGIMFLSIGAINEVLSFDTPLFQQCLIGATMITCTELVCGLVLNIWLQLGVWDYSHLPLNLMGQICLPFTVAWFFLSAPAIFLDDWLRWKLFKEEKPHYVIF
jgi:uncharacterized membrane protein